MATKDAGATREPSGRAVTGDVGASGVNLPASPPRDGVGVADTMRAGGASDPGSSGEHYGSRELAPGTILDNAYRVIKRIGGGAMGSVYLVEHLQLGRRFAAKVVAAAHGADLEIMARLRNEARVASSIQHENLVDVTHLGQTADGAVFVVMELLEGNDLRHRLTEQEQHKDQPWLDDDETRRIAREVLTGLHAAHEAGVVHRDLKPDNIFLAVKNGATRAKIVDFGISKVAGSPEDMRLTRTGQIMGTPLYMAPEQTRGAADIDRRADVYAMGVILYEMSTGRLPFEATTIYELIVKHATEAPPPPRTHRESLPEAVDAVIMRCLEKPLTARYQTARELLDAWEKAWAGGPASVRPPRPAPASVRPPKSAVNADTPVLTRAPAGPPRGQIIAFGVAVVLAVIGIGAFAFGRPAPETPAVVPAVHETPPPPIPEPPSVPVEPVVVPHDLPVGVPEPADVRRTIDSDPSSASIDIAGATVGIAPFDVVLPGGTPVEIVVHAPGRRPVTRTITAEDPPRLVIELERAARRTDPGLPTLAPR
jgi:serine/threonine protein kinase